MSELVKKIADMSPMKGMWDDVGMYRKSQEFDGEVRFGYDGLLPFSFGKYSKLADRMYGISKKYVPDASVRFLVSGSRMPATDEFSRTSTELLAKYGRDRLVDTEADWLDGRESFESIDRKIWDDSQSVECIVDVPGSGDPFTAVVSKDGPKKIGFYVRNAPKEMKRDLFDEFLRPGLTYRLSDGYVL